MSLALALACALAFAGPALAAPNKMSRADIIKIAKTIPGFSYWWGGAKWKPGDLGNKGKCTPNSGSSGCPNCSHSGLWGADCSGFVGKAWQIDKPTALETYYHPYATSHFKSQSTWWNHIARKDAKIADAFNYNTNGAGHIFLYEKGDPWGSVWAWECAGCKTGCVYNLRSVGSSYEALQRKLLVEEPNCQDHCEGSVMVNSKCEKGDCGAYGSKCVHDDLGLRCVFGMCPNKGAAKVCLPDGKLATCSNGQITASACPSGTSCKASSATAAACIGSCPASCDDGNGCTKDACDASSGKCAHTPNGAACDDGNACTTSDACSGTACKPGKAKGCDDGDPCTADSCSGGACQHKAKACDDGDLCTADGCQGGACQHLAKACDDGDACTADSCQGGACAHLKKACDDGDPCTVDQACQGGACAATPLACDDGDACTTDACQGGACQHLKKACDDGQACTSDACAGGLCQHIANACDDGDACTKDSCDAGTGACSSAPTADACDDGDPCTKDVCQGKNCNHFAANGVPCGAGMVCHALQCVPASSVPAPATGGGAADADGSTSPGVDASSPGAGHAADSQGGGGAPEPAAPDAGRRADASATGDVSGTAATAYLPSAPASSGCSATPRTAGRGAAAPAALCALALAPLLLWRRRRAVR